MTAIRREGSSTHFRGRYGAGLLGFGITAMLLLTAGCRQDMHNEPKFVPQRGTTFFDDGRSVRPQVANTVARGQLDEDDYFHTGLLNGKEVDMLPFPASMQVLERGQERYNIYCTPCHSRVGNGDGMIVQRGYKPAGNLQDSQRLKDPLGHYFYVMTYGYGAMPDYAAQLAPADRWAIAAYIRALQLSQNASQSDVPAGVTVQNLKDIAQQEGYPESFAEPWGLPANTAATAEPPDRSQGSPGMAPPSDIPPPILNTVPGAPLADGAKIAPSRAK